MTDQPRSLPEPILDRLTTLEMLVTHLERTIGDLSAAMCDQQKQLDEFGRRLHQLTLELGTLSAGPPEARKPEDEKPPHY